MSYAIGDVQVTAWIRDSTAPGLTINSAIPPGFASYATVVIPDDTAAQHDADRILIDLLRRHSPDSKWWLGYLETGGAPLPFPDAPRVRVYRGWQYVLVHAGPDEALAWRQDEEDRTLPDLIFPDDRSWLVSTLWDDDWRCIGGPADLVDAIVETTLETRVVSFDEDATPPGHVAY